MKFITRSMPVLALLFLSVNLLPLVAQEATPEPEATEELPAANELIFNWNTEVIFPQAVRFFVTPLMLADQIRQATLIIEPEGQPRQTIAVDVSEPLLAGDSFTDMAYIWEFDPSLPLFSDVTYEWRIEDASGAVASLRDHFVFADQRIQWVQDEAPASFIDLTVPADGPTPQQIRQSITPAYELISANARQEQRFNMVLYHGDLPASACVTGEEGELVVAAPISGTVLPCEETRAAQIYEANGYMVVQSRSTALAGAQAALIERLTAQLYAPLWEGQNVPDWFKVGLAQFYVPTPKVHLAALVQNAARNNQLASLDRMGQEPALYDENWRAQSYAMVLYIADLIGVQGLYDLARAVGNADGGFEAAYAVAAGQSLDALLPNLRRWVFTDEAVRAFGYTPYQAETATPTATATATHTPTPSATLTETPTVTPSVTGELTNTPTPTLTPSRTFTPLPATVTPRPASSLFTPTPTPVPNPLAEPTTQSGVLAVLFVALAVVGAVYLFMRRRDDD